jgi:hypothetical protein
MAQSKTPEPPKEFGRLLCHDDGGGRMPAILIFTLSGLGAAVGTILGSATEI